MAKNMFIKTLLIPAITIAQVALGAISEPDRATIVTRNAIQNPGAENGKSGWAVSTGSFTASNSTPIAGNASFVWDAGASNETLSVAFTVPEWLKGQNAVASCQVRCATGTCTHVLEPLVAGVAQGTTSITSSTTASPRVTANFIAPTSGAMGLQLRSTANEPSLKVDSCIIARADEYNLSQVSQATLYGTLRYTSTTNCLWSVSSAASFTSFPADTDCPTATVTGGVSAPTTKVPGVRLQNLPPGNYAFYVTNFFQKQNAASEEYALRFFDGTNGFSPQGAIAASDAGQTSLYGFVSYTAAQSDITVQLQAIRNGTNAISIRGDTRDFEISVYRFPTSSETAARVDTLPASWSGYHDNTCTYSRTSATIGDFPADSTCGFTELTNRNFGTVTSALSGSDKLPGVVFTPARAGRFLVLANFSGLKTVAGNTATYELYDGTTGLNYTQFSSPGNEYVALTLQGVVVASSTSPVTLKIRGAAESGDVRITGSTAAGNSFIRWTIIALDQSFPAPLLVGSVTSNSSGMERVERATITSPTTITSQSGSWLSSVTNGSTGNYTLTIASGIFSATPSCVFQPLSGERASSAASMNSATSVAGQFRRLTTPVGDLINSDFTVICMGPR